jgi:hypothetical protein
MALFLRKSDSKEKDNGTKICLPNFFPSEDQNTLFGTISLFFSFENSKI